MRGGSQHKCDGKGIDPLEHRECILRGRTRFSGALSF